MVNVFISTGYNTFHRIIFIKMDNKSSDVNDTSKELQYISEGSCTIVPFGFRVYKFLARCTIAYGGVNHSVTGSTPWPTDKSGALIHHW